MEILEPDPAKLFGIRRTGCGVSHYKRVITFDPCAYCGADAPLGWSYGHEVDHIRSRFKGGPNHWTNYTAACRFCNVGKYDMVLGQLLALYNMRRGIKPISGL